jgi:hypothetical protein
LTIEDIGNVGELIAAIATVITLVYLALQIRQNTKSVQGSAIQSHVNLELVTYALIAQHADVFERGGANVSDLNGAERIVFEQLVASVMSVMDNAYSQYQSQLFSGSNFIIADWQQTYLKLPGFQSVWDEMKRTYPEDFYQFIDAASKTTDVNGRANS